MSDEIFSFLEEFTGDKKITEKTLKYLLSPKINVQITAKKDNRKVFVDYLSEMDILVSKRNIAKIIGIIEYNIEEPSYEIKISTKFEGGFFPDRIVSEYKSSGGTSERYTDGESYQKRRDKKTIVEINRIEVEKAKELIPELEKCLSVYM